MRKLDEINNTFRSIVDNMTEDISEELEELASSLNDEMAGYESGETDEDHGRSTSDTVLNEPEDNNENSRLSKEEIAENFEVQFAKKPGNSVQHLVRPREDDTLCSIGLADDVKRIDNPGPFDPICGTCRSVVEGGLRGGEQKYNDLRRWLAGEIEEVREPSRQTAEQIRRSELKTIVEYIQSLKKENK